MHGSFGHMMLKSSRAATTGTGASSSHVNDRDTASASHPTVITSSGVAGAASQPSAPPPHQQYPGEVELEHDLRRALESLLSALEKQRAAAAKLSKVRLASYMLKFEDELATQVKAQATAVDRLTDLHAQWISARSSDAWQPAEPEAEPEAGVAPLQLLEIVLMALGSVGGGAALDEQVSVALCRDIRTYVDTQMRRQKRLRVKQKSSSESQVLVRRRPAKPQSVRCQRQSLRRQQHQAQRQQQQEAQDQGRQRPQKHRDQDLVRPSMDYSSSDVFRSSDVLQKLQGQTQRPQGVKPVPQISRNAHGRQSRSLRPRRAGAPAPLASHPRNRVEVEGAAGKSPLASATQCSLALSLSGQRL